MQIVTAADFEAEVLKSDKPVLVDFFATWCGPCKALAPILEQIADENADGLKMVKVDVDASEDLCNQYQIQAMPTLLMFRDGQVIAQKVGAELKSGMVAWIDASLALPAGTTVDLAPKRVPLSDADKQKLRDVFETAVNASPEADTLGEIEGTMQTPRKYVEEGLKSGKIFEGVEQALGAGYTLDGIIDQVKKGFNSLKPSQP